MMLAVCVCIFHANPGGLSLFLSGGAAVYVFFVISGYYMQMVLETKYSRARLGGGWLRSFYLARYLRLFPAYAVACLILLGVFFWGDSGNDVMTRPITHGLELFASGRFKESLYAGFLLLSNLTMFGLNVPSVADILVPPSWTLGVELSFYALAPFLLNQPNRVLSAAVFLGLLARLIPYNTHTPLLAGIDMFCLGALVYRGRDALMLVDALFNKLRPAGVFVLLALVVTFTLPRWDFLGIAKTHNELDVLVYPFVFALIIPSLFKMTANSAVDRFIGELSYPFYIFHQIIVDALQAPTLAPYLREGGMLAAVATLLTAGVAVVFYLLESRFIEPVRAKLSTVRPPQPGQVMGRADEVDSVGAVNGAVHDAPLVVPQSARRIAR